MYHTVSMVAVLRKEDLIVQLVIGSFKFFVADVICMGVVENGNEIVEGMSVASTHSSFGGIGGVFVTPKVSPLFFRGNSFVVRAEIEMKYFFPAVASKAGK